MGPNPYAAIQSLSGVRLFCDCVDSSPPASAVHRIFQHDLCPRKMGTCGHRQAQRGVRVRAWGQGASEGAGPAHTPILDTPPAVCVLNRVPYAQR